MEQTNRESAGADCRIERAHALQQIQATFGLIRRQQCFERFQFVIGEAVCGVGEAVVAGACVVGDVIVPGELVISGLCVVVLGVVVVFGAVVVPGVCVVDGEVWPVVEPVVFGEVGVPV